MGVGVRVAVESVSMSRRSGPAHLKLLEHGVLFIARSLAPATNPKASAWNWPNHQQIAPLNVFSTTRRFINRMDWLRGTLVFQECFSKYGQRF